MYGAVIAFKNFTPRLGILGRPWVGLQNFKSFFTNTNALRTITNTIAISFLDILFGFPIPIILALMINEVRNKIYKKVVQTLSYLPHFISLIVVCGIILDFSSSDGVVNSILSTFEARPKNYLMDPNSFRGIFVGTNI